MNNQVKPKVLGYWPGKSWKQDRAVYCGESISLTIVASMGTHANQFIHILEVKDD